MTGLNSDVETILPDLHTEGTLCKQKTSQDSVSLKFQKNSLPRFWFRITTVNSEFLLNVSVIINEDKICYERHFHVSAMELDVTCDTNLLLATLELRGFFVLNQGRRR